MLDDSIAGLLKLYDHGKLCLPSIQRGYEWKQKQVAKLIDSLYRGIPIGLFLFWEPENLGSKHFKDLKGSKSTVPTIAIIDGQQRLTSIHLVQAGDIPVVFNTSDPNGKFQIENKATKADPKWVLVVEVWKAKADSKFKREIAKKMNMTSHEDTDELNDKLDKIMAIQSTTPANHTITEENYEKITEIFRTINESGKKLSKSDSAYAIAALKFPGIVMEQLTSIQQQNKNWKTSTATRNDFFANALATISTNTVKMKPFQDYLLNAKTTKSKMRRHLKNLKSGTARTYEFLQEEFGINEKNNNSLIPNRNALIPLVNLFGQTKGRLPQKQTELLKLWVFLAFHHSQYTGKAYRNIDPDIRAIDPNDTLKTIQFWLKSIENQFGGFKVSDLGSVINDKSRFSVFFALKENKAKDWWTGTSIENLTKTEYHHIFPKKVLDTAGYTKSEINDPRNIAIISEYTNRKQKASKPIDYFNDRSLIANPERLFNQYVPDDEDLWEVKNYKNFLEERGILIMNALNKFVDATKI